MEHSTRLAHISEDGTRTQTIYDHLAGTARLAGSFAAPAMWQSAWRSALLWVLPLPPTSAASAPLPAM